MRATIDSIEMVKNKNKNLKFDKKMLEMIENQLCTSIVDKQKFLIKFLLEITRMALIINDIIPVFLPDLDPDTLTQNCEKLIHNSEILKNKLENREREIRFNTAEFN